MRRVYLRGCKNVLKRQLIHVGAFNLSLIFRHMLGAGTPRELRNRLAQAIFVALTPKFGGFRHRLLSRGFRTRRARILSG
jgi:hypothetical protein